MTIKLLHTKTFCKLVVISDAFESLNFRTGHFWFASLMNGFTTIWTRYHRAPWLVGSLAREMIQVSLIPSSDILPFRGYHCRMQVSSSGTLRAHLSLLVIARQRLFVNFACRTCVLAIDRFPAEFPYDTGVPLFPAQVICWLSPRSFSVHPYIARDICRVFNRIRPRFIELMSVQLKTFWKKLLFLTTEPQKQHNFRYDAQHSS